MSAGRIGGGMLGSWTRPDAASTKAKLAKYRARITAARNQLNHAVILEQVKKYTKWVPNTCYVQLVQAECLMASGDVEGASAHLDAGLQLDQFSSLDRTEAIMWKGVLAYVAGDSQDTLKYASVPPPLSVLCVATHTCPPGPRLRCTKGDACLSPQESVGHLS